MPDILSFLSGALVVGNLAVDAYELVGRVWSLRKVREKLDDREARLDDFLDQLGGLNANLRLINQGVLYAPDIRGVQPPDHLTDADIAYRPREILGAVRAVRGDEPLVASAMVRNSPDLKRALAENPFNVFADCAPLTPERAAKIDAGIPVIFTYGQRHFISRTDEQELRERFGLRYDARAHPLNHDAPRPRDSVKSTQSLDPHLPTFMHLYDKGSYEEAIRACDDFIRRGDSAGYAYYIRGAARHKLGLWRGAVADHDRALRLQDDLPQARYRLEAHHRALLERAARTGGDEPLQASTRRILERYSRALGPGILAALRMETPELSRDGESPSPHSYPEATSADLEDLSSSGVSGGRTSGEEPDGYLDFFLRGDYVSVIRRTSLVLEAGPDATALYYRAKSHAALGMTRRALRDIGRAVELGVPYSDAKRLQNHLQNKVKKMKDGQ